MLHQGQERWMVVQVYLSVTWGHVNTGLLVLVVDPGQV